MDGHRMAWRVATPVLLLVTLAVIWILTVQTPSETTELSNWWSTLLSFTGLVDTVQASFIVRKIAHIVEFLPVGLFTALAALAWFDNRWPHKNLAVGVAIFCIICSLADQIHKLFVPGREFDGRDLVCDAVGYLAGIAIAFAVTKLMLKADGARN